MSVIAESTYPPRAGIGHGGSAGCLDHAVRRGTPQRCGNQLVQGGAGKGPVWPFSGGRAGGGSCQVCRCVETGQLSYLCVLPMFPRDLSAAAAPREELRYRE